MRIIMIIFLFCIMKKKSLVDLLSAVRVTIAWLYHYLQMFRFNTATAALGLWIFIKIWSENKIFIRSNDTGRRFCLRPRQGTSCPRARRGLLCVRCLSAWNRLTTRVKKKNTNQLMNLIIINLLLPTAAELCPWVRIRYTRGSDDTVNIKW